MLVVGRGEVGVGVELAVRVGRDGVVVGLGELVVGVGVGVGVGDVGVGDWVAGSGGGAASSRPSPRNPRAATMIAAAATAAV